MPTPEENYSYIISRGGDNVFKTEPSDELINYGQLKTLNLPLTSSIDIQYFTGTENRTRIHALKNVLDRNVTKSRHFLCTSDLGDKLTQDLTLVSIPSIFFGSSIEKGSVELNAYYSGSFLAKLQDSKLNGELIETTGSNSGSVAGVILYNQGFIVLTGSWDIYNSIKWNNFNSSSEETNASSSFNLKFNGTTYTPTLMMLAHAPKGQFNHSNNPTYSKFDQIKKTAITSSHLYVEPSDIEIKNITKYPYENYSGSLEKQVYISKIGIYDDKKNLIGIAKLAKPVRKSENRDFTFKLKLDL